MPIKIAHRTFVAFCIAVLTIVSTGPAQETSSEATVRSPAATYAAFCAACHGAQHQGGMGTSLADGQWRYGADDQTIARNIRDGIATMGMPAFGQAMSDAEIRDMVTYLKTQAQQLRVKPTPLPPSVKTELHSYRIETVAQRVRFPWAIDWLPDGTTLITQKGGQLRLMRQGVLLPEPVTGTPQVLVKGQGGLLDVAVDPDYAETGWIYLAYTHESPKRADQAMTRIVRGRLRDHAWVDEQVLFEAQEPHYLGGSPHFGCRIVFDRQGHLYFGIGDRGEMRMAQNITRPNGKIHRIHRDGSIPRDNPFVDQKDAYPSIYAYGVRNPQGLAIDPRTDRLWETEHGPMGGDELNWIEPGANYGWPVITYGINYNGRPISELTHKEGMQQPVTQWTPSPALCGLDFYRGDAFSKWKHHLLVGALKFEQVKRVVIEDGKVVSEEVIFERHGRVRDVSTGPDGYIYIVLNNPDKIVRLVPG